MVSQDDDVVMFGGFFDQPHKPRWSLVTIRDSLHNPTSNTTIFPPVNHENLHIQDQHHHYHHHHPPSTSDLNTQALPSTSKDVVVSGFHVLRAKICRLFGINGVIRRVFGSAAGVAVLVMWWWFCRRVRRRRTQRQTVEYLNLIIKQKDEKITQLLHQIAQINEVLVARHKVLTSKLPS